MSSGVKRWEMRDISGEAFSTLCESCYTEVRIELSRVVDNCGLYCEQEDSDRDLSMPLNIKTKCKVPLDKNRCCI